MTTSTEKSAVFQFKQFAVQQDRCTMKVGTDGVLLGAWANVENAATALDIGTGCGVIALMLAQRSASLQVHAVEIEPNAYEQALENISNTPWRDRVRVFNAAIQDYAVTTDQRYDLIVSNPPFFSGGTFSHNQDKNNVRHTIKLPHGDLLSAVRTLLSTEGRFCVVLPFIEGLRLQELAKRYNLHCTHLLEVQPKANKPVERLLMQFEKQEKPLVKDNLIIQYDGVNAWTEEYKALTGVFYLYM